MYQIKIKGRNDMLTLNDTDGDVVDKAYEKWNTTKVDTFLKLPTWRGPASSIGSIQIEKQKEMHGGVDSDMYKQMRADAALDRAECKCSPQVKFEAYTRRYFCFLTYAFKGVYPTEKDFPLIQQKYAFLIDWFRDNPKRLIPDHFVVYPDIDFKEVRKSMSQLKETKDLFVRMTMYNAYLSAAGRDLKEVKYR